MKATFMFPQVSLQIGCDDRSFPGPQKTDSFSNCFQATQVQGFLSYCNYLKKSLFFKVFLVLSSVLTQFDKSSPLFQPECFEENGSGSASFLVLAVPSPPLARCSSGPALCGGRGRQAPSVTGGAGLATDVPVLLSELLQVFLRLHPPLKLSHQPIPQGQTSSRQMRGFQPSP